MRRERQSAKKIVHDFANELLTRTSDPDRRAKLVAIETIAMRMGWNDLYNKLRFKSGLHPVESVEEKWWQK